MAVVGGGPAGLMAAAAAAERGLRVILLEQLPRLGAKLLASGGGRCNLTNTLDPSEFPARFGRQGRFIQPALTLLGPQRLRALLGSLGVPTGAPDGLHVYPRSGRAADVLAALRRRACKVGVRLRLGVRVAALWIECAEERGPVLRGVETDGGRIAAPRVILATGGRSRPDLGGTGGGYGLARQAGHTLVEPVPALVPLVTQETFFRRCAGVSLSPARVWIDVPRHRGTGCAGDVLFTHTGLSGPAVLDLSGDVAALLKCGRPVPIRMDLTPGTSAAEWSARFDRWQAACGGKSFRSLLARHLPRSVADVLVGLAGIGADSRPTHVPRAARRALAQLITAMSLTVTATAGWHAAMVTRGGVILKEVDPHTLGSRRLRGLALAGEILDLDGPCGGFNLQWAFSSGHLAGVCI